MLYEVYKSGRPCVVTWATSLLSCVMLLIASSATAEPIRSGAIQVIDGDTISASGRTTRLRPTRAAPLDIIIDTDFYGDVDDAAALVWPFRRTLTATLICSA